MELMLKALHFAWVLLAVMARSVFAQEGATEVTVAQIKADPGVYASKLIAVAGTARQPSPLQKSYTLEDHTGSIEVQAPDGPAEGAKGMVLGTVQPRIFGQPLIIQALWLGEGEQLPQLSKELIRAVGLEAKADNLATYCDRLVLATHLSSAWFVRVVVVGPRHLIPDEVSDVAVGIFPHQWNESSRPDQTGIPRAQPSVEIQHIKVALIYPDDTVRITGPPATHKYSRQAGEHQSRWVLVEPPAWWAKAIGDIVVGAVVGELIGPLWAIAEIGAVVLEGEPGAPLADLSIQEFENRYDLLNLPTDSIFKAQALAYRAFVASVATNDIGIL